MARLNREVVTTVIIDASKARSGAEDFDKAAARVANAANAMTRIVERQTAMLGEQAKQYARLKREIDPAGVALEKFAAKQKILEREFKNNTSNPEYVRLLGLLEAKYKVAGDAASAMAAKSQDALDRIRARYDPLFAANQRYKQELKDLLEAQQAGLVAEPDFRREHARIER